MSVEYWAEFFQEAGLEPAVAASYANIFFVNKIQPSHLPDIDRDALREMNITPMGDILTILKYIKISCALVAPPTNVSGNEQLFFHKDDVLKSHAQFGNIQNSKNGYCGQNRFEAQHTITKGEKSFLSRLSPSACQIRPLPSATATPYVQSTDILAGGDVPTTTVVHQSPLNLTVHRNSSTKEKHSASQHLEKPDCEASHGPHSNVINSTVSCDTSEARSHIYSISPDKHEMGRNYDGLKHNLETSMNLSNVESYEWQQPLSFSSPAVPDTLLKHSNTAMINCAYNSEETLSCRPLVERTEQDYSQNTVREMAYTKSAMNQTFSKEKIIIPGGGTPRQKLSVFDRLGQRSDVERVWVKSSFEQFRQNRRCNNELRLKRTPQKNNGIMRSNHLRKKWYYSPVDDDWVNNNTESVNKMAMGHEPLPEESLCLQNKTDNDNTNKELISESHVNIDKIGPKCSNGNSKNHLEGVPNGNLNGAGTPNTGPGTIFITDKSPSFSSSSQNKDPELESLRDPTLTQHTEQFYLAWADRRKRAHSFPALKPSFLQVS